jgi:hypothetical protein
VDARVSLERKASRLSRMDTSITNSNKWKKNTLTTKNNPKKSRWFQIKTSSSNRQIVI